MEHIGDAAWFPGAVVTHNEACNVALDPFKSVDVFLVGVPYAGSILKGGGGGGGGGGIWLGIGRLCLQSWGQFLRFLLI